MTQTKTSRKPDLGSLRCSTVGVVIEQGTIEGVSYRVWQRKRDGKKFVYVGDDSRRHNMGWLKKRQKGK